MVTGLPAVAWPRDLWRLPWHDHVCCWRVDSVGSHSARGRHCHQWRCACIREVGWHAAGGNKLTHVSADRYEWCSHANTCIEILFYSILGAFLLTFYLKNTDPWCISKGPNYESDWPSDLWFTHQRLAQCLTSCNRYFLFEIYIAACLLLMKAYKSLWFNRDKFVNRFWTFMRNSRKYKLYHESSVNLKQIKMGRCQIPLKYLYCIQDIHTGRQTFWISTVSNIPELQIYTSWVSRCRHWIVDLLPLVFLPWNTADIQTLVSVQKCWWYTVPHRIRTQFWLNQIFFVITGIDQISNWQML